LRVWGYRVGPDDYPRLLKMMYRWMLLLALALAAAAPARAETAPDELIRQLSVEVIDTVKADKAIQGGDVSKIVALVDAKVLPLVNFQLMTKNAVGRRWNEASADQQKRLQEEFKVLLVRSYSGALTQVTNQTVEIKPPTLKLSDSEVEVRTLVVGGKEPLQLAYRLEKSSGQWKIYNVNVLGSWLVENYRTVFNQQISAGGIDGLINYLAERNKGTARS
jgi:phospholipid transport system substrate-binding protein